MRSDGSPQPAYDVAYQGQPGAFSEDAAFDFVPRSARLLPSRTLQDAFDSVARQEARYAVIPVENTLAGPIGETYDLLSMNDLVIVDETVQTISHCLISMEGADVGSLKQVLSHPIALAQCAGFLRMHPEWEPVSAFDTAGAVELVLEEKSTAIAAIGSARAAEVYGGRILMQNIQDHPENYTRFLFLSTSDDTYEGRGGSGTFKTSLAFQVPDAVRRMSGVLRPFIESGIPLTNVLSRPMSEPAESSEYHLDFIGSPGTGNVEDVLNQLKRDALSFKTLGTYPLRVATIREVVRPSRA